MNIALTSPQLTAGEELAFPFLRTAVEIDRAGENPDDRHNLVSVMANNAMLWTHLKTHFANTMDGADTDYVKYLSDVSQFMIKSTFLIARETDRAFLDKVIEINLKMCEQLLALSTTGETVGNA